MLRKLEYVFILCVSIYVLYLNINKSSDTFESTFTEEVAKYSIARSEDEAEAEKKALVIYHKYSDKPVKINIIYKTEWRKQGLQGMTKKVGKDEYTIYLCTYASDTLYHEVAHILTWGEKEHHGPEWKNIITKMGYPLEAMRY